MAPFAALSILLNESNKVTSNIARTNDAEYMGTSLSQILRIVGASKNRGTTNAKTKKKEIRDPDNNNSCIDCRLPLA